MDSLTIRPVTPDDAQAVADIYRYYVENTVVTFDEIAPSAGQTRDAIGEISSRWPYFVAAIDGDEIVGYCYAHPWKTKAAYRGTLETTVYLRPDMTSRGIGRRLMERLVGECRRRGDVHVLIACITADNEGSVRFHSGMGWSRVSMFREVGYKHGCYLDVIDMQLILDDK